MKRVENLAPMVRIGIHRPYRMLLVLGPIPELVTVNLIDKIIIHCNS
jgi:hypothetical protein